MFHPDRRVNKKATIGWALTRYKSPARESFRRSDRQLLQPPVTLFTLCPTKPNVSQHYCTLMYTFVFIDSLCENSDNKQLTSTKKKKAIFDAVCTHYEGI